MYPKPFLNILNMYFDVMYDLPAHLHSDLLRSLIEISCTVVSYSYFSFIGQVCAVRLADVYFPAMFST